MAEKMNVVVKMGRFDATVKFGGNGIDGREFCTKYGQRASYAGKMIRLHMGDRTIDLISSTFPLYGGEERVLEENLERIEKDGVIYYRGEVETEVVDRQLDLGLPTL